MTGTFVLGTFVLLSCRGDWYYCSLLFLIEVPNTIGPVLIVLPQQGAWHRRLGAGDLVVKVTGTIVPSIVLSADELAWRRVRRSELAFCSVTGTIVRSLMPFPLQLVPISNRTILESQLTPKLYRNRFRRSWSFDIS